MRAGKHKREKPFWVHLALMVVLGVGIALISRQFLLTVLYVPSDSMVPTFSQGDRLLLWRLDKDPQRGEVIAFTPGGSFAQSEDPPVFLKRVIAVGGDRVECCDQEGRIMVNGESVDEPYLRGGTTPFGPITLDADQLWVMGDNRAFSSDSRMRGPLERRYVLGTVFAQIWPLGKMQWL